VALLSSYQPWMVGRLIYPEAFWTTDTVGLRDPELERVEAQVASGRTSAGRLMKCKGAVALLDQRTR
jgi:hypothetical protein